MQVDDAALSSWCAEHLGAPADAVLFRTGHLAAVAGVRLRDGRQVVVKVRPELARLAGCVEVQRRMAAAGFPCPQPLCDPAPLGDLVATAETLVGGGVQLAADTDRPVHFADALAWLLRLAPAPGAVPSLEPPPPWAWPSAQAAWPAPDDVDADLNAVSGPAWLDALAGTAREVLLQGGTAMPHVVGHVDFESQNLRWLGTALHCVHDWDSVAALPEPAIAGVSSAMFTAGGAPRSEASISESERFLDAFQSARGRRWSDAEMRLAWAAGLWVRAFNAKKSQARGETAEVAVQRAELEARLRRVR